jgi:hypothetical protein
LPRDKSKAVCVKHAGRIKTQENVGGVEMSRYVYIVLDIVKKDVPDPGVTNYPFLGLHTNENGAQKHFDMLIEDRKARGAELCWDQSRTADKYDHRIREAYLKYDWGREQFVIEKQQI